MMNLFCLVVYIASAVVSKKYAGGYWVVGPVFGLAVVFYDSNGFKNLKPLKHLAFIAASSIIYALVFWMADAEWNGPSGALGDFVGPFQFAVLTGSILLPVAHKFILKQRAFRTLSVVISLSLSFYLLLLFEHFNSRAPQPIGYDFMTVAIALWQGLYLILFYKPERIKKEA